VIPSGKTAISVPRPISAATIWRARRASERLPRSMYSVPTSVLNQPTIGQLRISDFAMKVAGNLASTTKMSSQEM